MFNLPHIALALLSITANPSPQLPQPPAFEASYIEVNHKYASDAHADSEPAFTQYIFWLRTETKRGPVYRCEGYLCRSFDSPQIVHDFTRQIYTFTYRRSCGSYVRVETSTIIETHTLNDPELEDREVWGNRKRFMDNPLYFDSPRKTITR
jgi:hypothetical protein